MIIRNIGPHDNPFIEAIVREVMSEFDADPKTTVVGDPSLKTMYENYREKGAVYFVVELNDKIVGGGGIKHLEGSTENICELQRMFLLKEARGQGIGKQILQRCLLEAKNFGYERIYLESMSAMKLAISIYEKSGFKKIPEAIGKTGHAGCNIYMTQTI